MKTKIIVGTAVGFTLLLVSCGKSEKEKQAEQEQREAQMLTGIFQNLTNLRAADMQMQQQQLEERERRLKAQQFMQEITPNRQDVYIHHTEDNR